MDEILKEHFLDNGKNLGASPQDVADVIVKMYKKRLDVHNDNPHTGPAKMTPTRTNDIPVLFLDPLRIHKALHTPTSHQINLDFAIPGFNVKQLEDFMMKLPESYDDLQPLSNAELKDMTKDDVMKRLNFLM